MILSESVVDERRIRLPNPTERMNRATGFDALGGIFFGFLFVTAGAAIVLVGLQVIFVDPSRVHAPYWVLTYFGGIFTVSGILFWIKVLRQELLINRRKTLSALHPQSEVFADYPWNPQGVTKSPWTKVLKALVAILAFAMVLFPFNWWAWGNGGSFSFITCLVSLFDLLLLYCVYELVRNILAALKYGASRLEYDTFPFVTGDRVRLRWSMPSGLKNAESITFVLRCIEEWPETTGSGDDKRTDIIHEQLWATSRTADCRGANWPNLSLSLSFDVPASAPGSFLSADSRITFWELDVCATAPGVDFEEQYLVPVYRGAGSLALNSSETPITTKS